MPVPNSFANVTTSIPLSQLDANFNTPITLGNTAIQLGNTVTTLNNMTLANVTISTGNVTVTNATVTTANVTTANIGTEIVTTSQTLSYGTANGVVYLNASKVSTTGTALTYDGTTFTSGAHTVSTGVLTVPAGSNTAPSLTFSGDTNTGIFSPTADTIAFTEGGIESMRIDSAGNLGLGVTPSTWDSSSKAMQLGGGSIWSFSTSQFNLLQNAYYNSSGNFIYINSAAASAYRQISGAHSWLTAASGTAGNAITFTQAMTLDASGNLGIGTTSPSGRLHVATTGAAANLFVTSNISTSDLASRICLGNSSSSARFTIGLLGTAGESAYIGPEGAFPLTFQTNGSERARITSGGEVYIAGTTDQGAYNLQCNGTGVWGAGAYVNGSDKRIKDDITPLASGLDVVTKLNPVTYRYKEDWSKDQSVQTGFIAQELLTALDGQVYVDGVVQQGGSEGYYSVAYQNIIPILTKAIQEQQQMIETLQAKVAALEAK